VLVFIAAGCYEAPDRWAAANKAAEEKRDAVAEQAVSGGSFNKFFPAVEAPWDIVYQQEKDGFAQAGLTQDGKEVAVLTVADLTSNPSAKDKYQGSPLTIAGFPAAQVGSSATAVLVADRYQVQVRSADPAFDETARERWLAQFDLQGLSAVK
jgi:hypothetical protein